MKAETVEVPFRLIGNRRCLTYQQLREQPWLDEFYQRFAHRFEVLLNTDAVALIEDDETPLPATEE